MRFFLVIAASAAAAASPIAWRAATPSGAALEVYADDSYALFAPGGGAPWLASAPTAVHVRGAWFAAAGPSRAPAAPAPASCSTLADTDCRNVDLYFFNSTDPAACCANCSATPACGAWTWTGETEALASAAASAAAAPPPWANRCYIKAGCDYAAYAGHSSGLPPAAAPLPLVRLGAGASADGGYEIRYMANGTTPVTTSFALNATTGAFVFTQSFPLGASGVALLAPSNTSTGAGAGAGALGEFASSTKPATQFPIFVAADNNASSALGFLSWRGRFFGSLGSGGGGAGGALSSGAGGAEGGPLVLFEADGRGRAAVISPFDNFKSTMLGEAPFAGGGSAAAGVSGYVTSLPANFSTSTVVLFGGAGITDAVHAWGAALLARHGGGAKVEDPTSTQLTYWTDSE